MPTERVPSQLEMLVRGAAGALTTPRAGVRFVRKAAPRLPSIGRKETWKEIQNIVNEQSWLVWLPTLKAKCPVKLEVETG